MNPEPRFQTRLFLQCLAGAFAGAFLLYLLLSKTAVLSPLGTVVVPVIAFAGVGVVAFFMARGTK